ncbi:hypothetical protein [Streptomyces sp. NPDC052179]|uniref:hypothetical protein n=1 Tax=Streptomyces sp. NPDC052179 TaxID=3155680 RepID=UPI00343BF354
MAGSRHFRKNQDPAETQKEIQADITASRREQRELQHHGRHDLSERMRHDTDAFVDELSDLDAGRWKPKHA